MNKGRPLGRNGPLSMNEGRLSEDEGPFWDSHRIGSSTHVWRTGQASPSGAAARVAGRVERNRSARKWCAGWAAGYSRASMNKAKVALRYFPVLGRAQAIRHALWDAGVDFDDWRVTIADWPEHRETRAIAGPHRSLPTLTWDAALVSETLPIASFVARRLGQCDSLDDEAVAAREAICSACYLDVVARLADVIRADVTYGGDLRRSLAAVAPRTLQKLGFVDRQIPESGWIGGDQPVVADFFATEAFEVVRYVLGPARDSLLGERFPRLDARARSMRSRPKLATAWRDRPQRFTARPDEDVVIAQLRAVDLSSAGL
jgi:glutathione S-transferase